MQNIKLFAMIGAVLFIFGTAATPLNMQQSDAQLLPSEFPQKLKHRILLDNPFGASQGWDPNGVKKTFWIKDSFTNLAFSSVLINTKQSNFVVCSVDYLTDLAFEVNCDKAPANNAELRYTIFNTFSAVSPFDEEAQPELPMETQKIINDRLANATGNATPMEQTPPIGQTPTQ
jgi:hypothetical protein